MGSGGVWGRQLMEDGMRRRCATRRCSIRGSLASKPRPPWWCFCLLAFRGVACLALLPSCAQLSSSSPILSACQPLRTRASGDILKQHLGELPATAGLACRRGDAMLVDGRRSFHRKLQAAPGRRAAPERSPAVMKAMERAAVASWCARHKPTACRDSSARCGLRAHPPPPRVPPRSLGRKLARCGLRHLRWRRRPPPLRAPHCEVQPSTSKGRAVAPALPNTFWP